MLCIKYNYLVQIFATKHQEGLKSQFFKQEKDYCQNPQNKNEKK